MNEEFTSAVLVGIITDEINESDCMTSLNELQGLLETAGGKSFARLVQSLEYPNAKTYIGSGKLSELSDLCEKNNIELVVFDCELSPSQIRNIEEGIKSEVRVIDRTMLILDIFAEHAVTGEGILQVEIAHLKYTIPRLRGKGNELSRLGGGIGTRGPGESKLESDRRHIKQRISHLESELRELESKRSLRRKSRTVSGIPQIAIAGYTNVGKSTLLNHLTGSDVLAENKLFATLDPTTRRYTLPNSGEILLTDTVGFINNLPHHLVEAFKSTLAEVVYSDIILVLLDASSNIAEEQYNVTNKIIDELFEKNKTQKVPVIYVFNKCDLLPENTLSVDMQTFCTDNKNTVFISAATGFGIDSLISLLEEKINELKREVVFKFPITGGGILSTLYKTSTVKNVEYTADSIIVTVVADAKTQGQYKEYLVNGEKI